MKIGEHIGNYVTYRTHSGNQYKGYVFETITDEVEVLFIADERQAHFHSAYSYFHDDTYFLVKYPELRDDTYKNRCYWIGPNTYQPIRKILL